MGRRCSTRRPRRGPPVRSAICRTADRLILPGGPSATTGRGEPPPERRLTRVPPTCEAPRIRPRRHYPRRMSHRALAGLVAALLLPAAAQAADPGRWKLAGLDVTPTDYFQGLTHGPAGVYWIGPFDGAYRTDTSLKEQARTAVIYPQ